MAGSAFGAFHGSVRLLSSTRKCVIWAATFGWPLFLYDATMQVPALRRLSQQAARAADAGDWQAAGDAIRAMLDMRPGDPAMMLELSYVESLAGRYRQALDWTRRVEEGGGTGLRGETALSLLRRLRTFNELSALQRLATHWLQAGIEAQVLVECASS